jgi:DNA-dependent RNA polymerase auxiliary subunit epsilon
VHRLYICNRIYYLWVLTFPINSKTQRTEILHGSENVMNTILQFLSLSKIVCSCGDYKAPSLAIEVTEYRKLIHDLKKRDIKISYITDITKDNLEYCKELMQFMEEIRHLDGIKTNFSVSESYYKKCSNQTLYNKLFTAMLKML